MCRREPGRHLGQKLTQKRIGTEQRRGSKEAAMRSFVGLALALVRLAQNEARLAYSAAETCAVRIEARLFLPIDDKEDRACALVNLNPRRAALVVDRHGTGCCLIGASGKREDRGNNKNAVH